MLELQKLAALAVLLVASGISAGPAYRRADSDLKPWVSIDDKGTPTTVTPVLTTIKDVATTINPIPASLTATTTVSRDSAATSTTSSGSQPTSSGGAFEVCTNNDGDFAPFCLPTNGSSLYVGETTYVTWDTTHFDSNSTVLIQANFLNMSDGGSNLHLQAFQSDKTPNSWGFISWTLTKDFLKGHSSNNLTLYITADGRSVTGPTVQIAASHPSPKPKPTPPPDKESLLIALPIVLGFVAICLVGGCIFNRKHRHIGLGNVMGRRRGGYGVGKSRRQRLGMKNKKVPAELELRSREFDPENVYRDVPLPQQEARRAGHQRHDSETLGSLVGTPTEERSMGENVFRDEMRRQERERF